MMKMEQSGAPVLVHVIAKERIEKLLISKTEDGVPVEVCAGWTVRV
jgi:hypothetical protein